MSATTPTGEIHPVAALFPMLADDELDDLAAHIRSNGLLHAVVLDADGVLIDGRNRLEACRRAGVEPTYTRLNGQDAVAFILGANVNRRHLSAGQRAMLVAKARLVSKQPIRVMADSAGLKPNRVAYAAVVLEWAPELADQVLAGGSLDAAYRIASARKHALDQAATDADRAERDAAAARQRVQQLEDALEAKQQAVELAIEEIGPEVPITATPNLLVDLSEVVEGARHEGDVLDRSRLALDEEYATLQRLGAIKRRLQQMVDEFDLEPVGDQVAYVMAVRSAVSNIVERAYALADKYNRLLDQPVIRMVR